MESMPGPYADRAEAGQVLAQQLIGYADHRGNVLVLGLSRGGVPVAAPVAAALGAALDVLVVRKLGLPAQPELAMGAIAGVADSVEVIRNDTVLDRVLVSDEAFDEVYRREVTELRRREAIYRDRRNAAPIRGRVVIIVDDGLATGSTMRAAVAAVRRRQPTRVVAAVPAGSRATCEALRQEVEELMCAWTPETFYAVGQAYLDFSATSDDQVRQCLADATQEAAL